MTLVPFYDNILSNYRYLPVIAISRISLCKVVVNKPAHDYMSSPTAGGNNAKGELGNNCKVLLWQPRELFPCTWYQTWSKYYTQLRNEQRDTG